MSCRIVCPAFFLAWAAASSALATTTTVWNGGAGLWNSPNWSNGIPNASTDARIDNNTAVNSVVTVAANATAASIVLDLNDTLILGAGAGVTLTTSSVGNAGTITTGALYANLLSSGIIVNNGVIDAAGGSTLFLDSPSLVNNGLITADPPAGGNAAHIVFNHSNVAGGMSFSGAGNVSISNFATLLFEHPVAFSTSGWLDVNGQLEITSLCSLSVGALHGDSTGSISSTSTGLSTLTVTNGSASLAYAGTLSGNLSLVKSGPNTLILSGDNSYAGTTDVLGGMLQLDNPTLSSGGAGAGNLTVHSTAMLAGAGSTTCFTSVQSGGVLSPGDWGAGTFTATNSLQLLANSTLLLDIGNAPGTTDFIAVTGGQFSADAVNVQFTTHGSLTPGKTYPLLNWTGASLPSAITASTFHLVNGSAHGFFSVSTANDTVSFTETIPGDANQDGRVDAADLSTVLANFGKPTSLWTNGNFDGQTTVDLTDLAYVFNAFGTILSPPAAPASALPGLPAPEPSSLLLVTPLLLLFPRRNTQRPKHA